MKIRTILMISLVTLVSCTNKPSKMETWKAEKHAQDSIHLLEQERTLAYYQTQLDSLLPQADSVMQYFKYEKNEKYQDHGYYVVNGKNGLRVLVRDDGKDLLLYRDGKRVEYIDEPAVQRGQHLQILILDINELEKRIQKTSLEVQKYEKRLQNR